MYGTAPQVAGGCPVLSLLEKEQKQSTIQWALELSQPSQKLQQSTPKIAAKPVQMNKNWCAVPFIWICHSCFPVNTVGLGKSACILFLL